MSGVAGLAISALIVMVHVGVLLVGYTGPRARFLGGLAVIGVNYGLRRLLFLEPALGAAPMAWFGLILLGDLVLVLLVAMSLARPDGAPRLHPVDMAVGLLVLASVVLAVGDGRVPLAVRGAHWKEEYFYLAAYVLARLNGPRVLEGAGVLGSLAVAAVGLALWQALSGPLSVDIAWIASGRSVLAPDAAAVVGAHGLGNLDAGWLRPYGFFGNGTDFGVFLSATALLAVAARLPPTGSISLPALAGALLRPLPLVCVLGVMLSVVRITWLVLALGVVLMLVVGAVGSLRRWMRGAGLVVSLAGLAAGFLVVAPVLADSGSLWGRAFVTGTYVERWQAQAAYVAYLVADPAVLLLGEGFGGQGSAAAKFGFQSGGPGIDHHSRLFDLVQDGGLMLVALVLAPLVLAMRGGDGAPDPVRAAALSFCLAMFIAAAVLGAKSAVLQTLFWGFLGGAVNRAVPARPAPVAGRVS